MRDCVGVMTVLMHSPMRMNGPVIARIVSMGRLRVIESVVVAVLSSVRCDWWYWLALYEE